MMRSFNRRLVFSAFVIAIFAGVLIGGIGGGFGTTLAAGLAVSGALLIGVAAVELVRYLLRRSDVRHRRHNEVPGQMRIGAMR